MTLASTAEKEYVLGTGEDELSRLALQHRIWADAAVGAWKRAGIGPGQRVLDVGCGPGYASQDLSQLVGPGGRVLGVDESARFVEHVNAQARASGLTQLSATQGDVQQLPAEVLAGAPFDAAYARWTLCWLAHPDRAVAGVAGALRPGGKFVVQDYFNWVSMTAVPRSRAIERMIEAARVSFAEHAGDMDVCARLPAMFRKVGLEIVHVEVHQRFARGGGLDSTLAWPLTWWRTYGPKLVGMGKLTGGECDEALADLAELERDPDRFYQCPPVFEFIAARSAASRPRA